MTADIELLPLPEGVGVIFSPDGNGAALDVFTAEQVQDYARANVAHATAAKDAEIERLRAERDVLAKEATKYADKSGRLQAEVERLAEALREAMEWNWLDDDARPSRVADLCDAALRDQEEGK